MKDRIKYFRLRKRADRLEKQLLEIWRVLHPETELLIVSLPKDDLRERQRILEHVGCVYTGSEFACYCENEMAKTQGKKEKKFEKCS